MELTTTAVIAERDGGTTYVMQTADQEVRMFATVVAGGRHGAIVKIIGGMAGPTLRGYVEFSSLLAADVLAGVKAGDPAPRHLVALADKHTGYPLLLELEELEPVAQAKMAEEATAYLVGAAAGQGQLFTAHELRTGTPALEAAGQGALFEAIR